MKRDTGGMERRINEISRKRMTMISKERQKVKDKNSGIWTSTGARLELSFSGFIAYFQR